MIKVCSLITHICPWKYNTSYWILEKYFCRIFKKKLITVIFKFFLTNILFSLFKSKNYLNWSAVIKYWILSKKLRIELNLLYFLRNLCETFGEIVIFNIFNVVTFKLVIQFICDLKVYIFTKTHLLSLCLRPQIIVGDPPRESQPSGWVSLLYNIQCIIDLFDKICSNCCFVQYVSLNS